MAFPYPEYVKIKDKYCISYLGHNDEYIIQLINIRDAIQKELPGIQLYICCNDRLSDLKTSYSNILLSDELRKNKKNFAYIRSIRYEDNGLHPILNLLHESNITLQHFNKPTRIQNDYRKCIIICTGSPPTKSISDEILSSILARLKRDNRPVLVIKNQKDKPSLNDTGLIIGVECELLFSAAFQGIETCLVPTGVGTELYQTLFPIPHGQIWNVK